MIEAPHAPVAQSQLRPPPRRWIDWAIPLAGAWSLLYGGLGVFWMLGGAGFPFGVAGDPNGEISILAGADPTTFAPVVALLGLSATLVALAMARAGGGAPGVRRGLIAFAAVAAATLALVVPDFRVLAFVAYAPILVVGAPFGWPEDASLLDAVQWPLVNQTLLIAGGLAWAAAGVAYHRRTREACTRCGRGETATRWTTPQAAGRWGRWAVFVAVVIPVLYATTRLAWAFGIPLGITDEFLDEMQENGMTVAGAALATMGLGGAGLTLGLTQRWGEVFPRWIPRLAGRRVPPALAIVPASLVSVLVAMAGGMFVRLQVTGSFAKTAFEFAQGQWAALAPELLWPAWGVALAAAALAYHLRRRGPCAGCGRS